VIVRAPRKAHFTIVPNTAVRDARLSYRARGVLAYVLSMPDNWEASADRIAVEGAEGRDAVRKAIAELERAGYIDRVRERVEGGLIRTSLVVHDTSASAKPQVAPTTEKPSSVDANGQVAPTTEKPSSVDEEPPPTPENPSSVPPAETRETAGRTDDQEPVPGATCGDAQTGRSHRRLKSRRLKKTYYEDEREDSSSSSADSLTRDGSEPDREEEEDGTLGRINGEGLAARIRAAARTLGAEDSRQGVAARKTNRDLPPIGSQPAYQRTCIRNWVESGILVDLAAAHPTATVDELVDLARNPTPAPIAGADPTCGICKGSGWVVSLDDPDDPCPDVYDRCACASELAGFCRRFVGDETQGERNAAATASVADTYRDALAVREVVPVDCSACGDTGRIVVGEPAGYAFDREADCECVVAARRVAIDACDQCDADGRRDLKLERPNRAPKVIRLTCDHSAQAEHPETAA
jgi:hypothetical protein